MDEPEKGKHINIYLEFNKKVNILHVSVLDLDEYVENTTETEPLKKTSTGISKL